MVGDTLAEAGSELVTLLDICSPIVVVVVTMSVTSSTVAGVCEVVGVTAMSSIVELASTVIKGSGAITVDSLGSSMLTESPDPSPDPKFDSD